MHILTSLCVFVLAGLAACEGSSQAASTSGSITAVTSTFTTSGRVGVIGTDGITRYCTIGNHLCPASLNYGCCPNTRACGLAHCPLIATGTEPIGATITGSHNVGIVGTDGVTRFCTIGSTLCPASLDYGCCISGYACGLTNCFPSTAFFSSTSMTTMAPKPTLNATLTPSNSIANITISAPSVTGESAKVVSSYWSYVIFLLFLL